MNYNEFTNAILELVRGRVDEGINVTISSILKNNDVHMTGLYFKRDDKNAAPTIYLEYYYTRYCRGESIEELSDDLIDVFLQNELKEEFELDFYTDYEKVKDSIFCKIVNYANNNELLADVPYEIYADLAIVPYCAINSSQLGNASILVRNNHLTIWNIDKRELIKRAMENTANNMRCELVPMIKMLKELQSSLDMADFADEESLPLYVVTNENRYYGAIFMAMPEMLEKFAENLGGNYYILPSSVHELILLTEKGDEDVFEINQMIREINATQVSADEILSDHLYMYSAKERVLKF